MTTNYNLNGTDLDSIFAPLHPGWPQAVATNINVAGADLNERYAAISSGSGAPGTTFRVNSVDLNQIFAAIGSTGVQVGTQPTGVSGSSAAGNPSGVVTSNAATCAGAKGGGSYSYLWICSGCIANSPNSATTTFSATVNAGTVDNASAYCQISDRITFANTKTISVTLQNTTVPQYICNFNITAATSANGIGYSNSPPTGNFGTLNSASGFPAGTSLGGFFTYVAGGVHYFVLGLNIAADPGESALISFIYNGNTYTPSNANSYGWESGEAQWTWTSVPSMTAGDSYSGTATFTNAI